MHSSPESGPSSPRQGLTSPTMDEHQSHSSMDHSGYSSDHDHDHEQDQDSPTESERDSSPERKSILRTSHSPPHGDLQPLNMNSTRLPRNFFNTSSSSMTNNKSTAPIRSSRVRFISPLSTLPSSQHGDGRNGMGMGVGMDEFQPRLPKSQPLSRSLFNRTLSDTPHAGIMNGGRRKMSQKIIVPTKAIPMTFELNLSANEFARRN
ncbi:uncharacterized protein IL334_006110 [Kwoniella shivajii]|uniref:Uncharacterized protein n=1 Tax=Kwoniella shivajii TaxID=564305 RepID=A0ABZ1D841_9TREE|nr:hypothetical protein IL334_006110 [Kwoniella shivajii]